MKNSAFELIFSVITMSQAALHVDKYPVPLAVVYMLPPVVGHSVLS